MKRLTALLAGLVIGAPFVTERLQAAEWEREAGLSVGAEISDNICLGDDDQSARGFATATPDLRITGRGARANINLAGSVKYNTLGESDFNCSEGQRPLFTNRKTWIPNVLYRGDLELIDNWLTLESDASARTTNIDPFAPGDTGTFDGRGNTNIASRYGAGARIQRRLFNSADMLLRYNYNEQKNGVRQLGDSSESRTEFDLGTERANNRLSVGVAGRSSKVMYEGTDVVPAFDNTLSSAEVRSSLRLTTSWQFNALVGEEWNQFISLRPDIEGSYWDASARWSPNDRVEVELGTGERFFGTTPHMTIRYRHKRSELSANYNRSLTLPRDLRAANSGFDDPFDIDFGEDPTQFPDDIPTVNREPTFIGNRPVINERLNLTYRYSTRRTTISVTGSSSRQERLEDLNEATFSSVRFAFSRSLSSKLSANMSLGWSEREGRGGNVSVFSEASQNWRAVFGIDRRLGRNTTMSMDYQYNLRESDSAVNRYEENRIILSARHQF